MALNRMLGKFGKIRWNSLGWTFGGDDGDGDDDVVSALILSYQIGLTKTEGSLND